MDEHPTPETLVAYHAGELPADEQEALRDHLTLCHDCADLLLDLVSFAEFTPPEQAPILVDSEVEGAWQRFQPRLVGREEPEERKEALREEKPAPAVAQIGERRRRDMKHDESELAVVNWPRKVWTARAIAATLFLGVIALSLWTGALYQRLGESLRPHSSVPIDLVPEDNATRGPEDESESTVPPNAETFSISLRLDSSWKEFGTYEAEIFNAGAIKPSAIISGLLNREGVCFFDVPSRRDFPPGRYLVDLYGIEGGRREKVARFKFQIAAPQ